MAENKGAILYVDGFNLYYGALKRRPHLRWLDLEALGERLTPADHDLLEVKYFTAKVSNLPWNPATADRQEAYLRALGARPKVSVHLGHIVTNRRTARPVGKNRSDAPRARRVWVEVAEEKGSDVNLASEMLIDHFTSSAALSIVITDDTDLSRPIEFLRSQSHRVIVVSPRGYRLRRLGSETHRPRRIRAALLAQCQLPDSVRLLGGKTIQRPNRWH